MKRVRTKICGLTDEASVDAAVDNGADAIGFVFAPSPRQLSISRARELISRIPPFVSTVAVFRDESPQQVGRVVDEIQPDLVQIDADQAAALRGDRLLPVYRDRIDLPGTRSKGTPQPCLLFEGARSGEGRLADWNAARGYARECRLILAGGLDPQNVARAIERVRPWGVDVSSGVESSRGKKDPLLIVRFLAAVRNAEVVS